MYVRELTVRYRLRRVPGPQLAEGRLHTPREAALVVARLLCDEIVEVCGLLCLSTQAEVLAYHELSRGTIDMTFVHPRDVFRTALLAHAASVIVAHNHPSGDVTPSVDDRVVTQRLKNAGQVVGIELTDHVIVSADGTYFSFKESGSL